ncbi:MAG: hydroxymethylglutaryl-CoA lyase [Desulfuromonadales bacterium]|jgi:isopropylmalate/homocitrate/citramalate synthase|nr:hydroxymethylglutaryl-CoA lyase [Desulfuromonadales bacterium]
MNLPQRVKLVEVGPRDGLQNESRILAANDKIALIDRLSETGLNAIEVSSFVSPERVPQMADAAEVFTRIQRRPGVHYPVLVPNTKGLEAALLAGVSEIAVFGAATETFSQRNIGCSIEQSLERFAEVVKLALAARVKVRGYISCVAGCPYEGAVAETTVAELACCLIELGCYEVSLGDTTGVATPGQVKKLLQVVSAKVPKQQLAVHFHDTYGQGLANILVALQEGVAVVDCSVSGLGGCPFAPGASGNVATEDVLYMMNGLGVHTGVDIDKLIEVGQFACHLLDRPSGSKVARAFTNRCE